MRRRNPARKKEVMFVGRDGTPRRLTTHRSKPNIVEWYVERQDDPHRLYPSWVYDQAGFTVASGDSMEFHVPLSPRRSVVEFLSSKYGMPFFVAITESLK